MTTPELPQSSIVLFQSEDGRVRIQCRFEGQTVWLPQKLIAELYQSGVNTVNHHLKEIFSEGERRISRDIAMNCLSASAISAPVSAGYF